MTLSPADQAEIDKYVRAYRAPSYAMGTRRYQHACAMLSQCGGCTSYLDVGCGRGEMIEAARRMGFKRAAGIEVVPELIGDAVEMGLAWDLPFDDASFDVVASWDVLEHLREERLQATVVELARVARQYVFVTTNNARSVSTGEELHITRYAYEKWDALFKAWLTGWQVIWCPRRFGNISETWCFVSKDLAEG